MNPSENKMRGRRENRAAAMQFAYMRAANKDVPLNQLLDSFFETKEEPREFYGFASELIAGMEEHSAEIDAAISKSAKNWSMDRIARVDLAILRLAVFELLFRDDIPPIVSINEAVDLAKTYSTAESKRFINGVLDNVKNGLNRPLRTPLKHRCFPTLNASRKALNARLTARSGSSPACSPKKSTRPTSPSLKKLSSRPTLATKPSAK